MSKFKADDTVEAVGASFGWGNVKHGDMGRVTRVCECCIEVEFPTQKTWWAEPEDLKIVTEGEKKMTTKYYRVIKESPSVEMGAILSNEGGEHYKPIDDVFYKEVEGYEPAPFNGTLVENQSEWFERVYPISKLEKMVFGSRKQAQAAAAALYEDK